jgi:hypothetical protein
MAQTRSDGEDGEHVGAGPVVRSVRDTARILGIGERQCYEGIHRGQIPHIKIGKRFWVPHWFFRQLREGSAAE